MRPMFRPTSGHWEKDGKMGKRKHKQRENSLDLYSAFTVCCKQSETLAKPITMGLLLPPCITEIPVD